MQADVLCDKVFSANLFLRLEPVLLGRTARSATLHVKLIGTHADFLLQHRRGLRFLSKFGQRGYWCRHLSAIPVLGLGFTAPFLWRCAVIGPCYFRHRTWLLNPKEFANSPRPREVAADCGISTITNFGLV